MKTFLIILITAALAIGGTLLFKSRMSPTTATSTTAERKVHHYQCAMHPQVKSDKPGRCTICGMELTPIFEGHNGLDATGGENVLALSRSQIQVLDVQTETAKVQPLVRTLRVAGMIDDDATRHRILSAYVDGRIEKLHVNFMGAEVEAGQPLAEYYSPGLLQAEREYRHLTGDLRKATALRLRQMGLTPGQIEAVATKPADSLTSQILSPIGGTVVGQHIYEGQYVTTGERLFEIADFSTMWFMFRAYEQDMPWIKLGQAVTIATPALPGQPFEGKITFIDPNFEEATRSTKVRVELPNPKIDGRRVLLHRLYADGAVQLEAPSVLTIPRSAIIQTGPEAVVYIDKGGGAYAQAPVKIGRSGDALVEILSGLKAGDHVVTHGNLLIDGQAELNRAIMPPVNAPMPDGILTELQQLALRDFIKVADAMAAALAASDLAPFNRAAEPAMPATRKLTEALAGHPDLDALGQTSHVHGFNDLKAARAAFLKFSLAANTVLEPLRKMKAVPEFQIWECPMVDQAIPGAAKKGRWIQAIGRPGQNPYFGAEMIDCGKEINP